MGVHISPPIISSSGAHATNDIAKWASSGMALSGGAIQMIGTGQYSYFIGAGGSGSVNIGDPSAYASGATLQVNGDIWFSGNMNANGTTGVSGTWTPPLSITVSSGIVTAVS